ncbi:MAG: flagellar basal body rod protein FlgC [Rickettsiales bacterium TMED254]|nr:flagellar basal body rod protein FlgC [Rickettsiales bacterium]RPF77071.1 MAG: flagellar basal body rod protein FlgC [Rickettsiales bacterium TMED254]
MMEIKNIYNITKRAMGAQLVRLNAIASNLANADNIASSPENAYKPIKPVFETKYFDVIKKRGISTVDAVTVKQMDVEPIKEYKPGHPMADENGFIYKAPVSSEEEYVEMLEASRHYQNNVEVISTIKALMLKTANLGK